MEPKQQVVRPEPTREKTMRLTTAPPSADALASFLSGAPRGQAPSSVLRLVETWSRK